MMEFIIMLSMILLLLIGIAGNYYIFKRPLKESVGETLSWAFFGMGIGFLHQTDYLLIVISIGLLILSVILRHYACHLSLKDSIINGLITGLIAGIVIIVMCPILMKSFDFFY